jgi:predicted  nucleic acid-binding Zn-ribbon protein
VSDVTQEPEPPETPAPVFAARAIKSAIFGTPAPPDDDTIYDNEKESNTMAGNGIKKPQARSVSPTKPPGILLTPGTATTRRKTVSFGNEVVEKEEKIAAEKPVGRSGIPNDCPGKFPSPFVGKSEPSIKSSRNTALTRKLENAREGKKGKDKPETPRDSSEARPLLDLAPEEDATIATMSRSRRRKASIPQTSNQDLLEHMVTGDDFLGDLTMDLNEPHSQSGKYWKSEYENFHEEAKTEMRKLLKYKDLAKSYAKKKDEENLDLIEKLKEQQRRVLAMEDKISKLSAQIGIAGLEGNDDDSPELMKELASQTALAVQYKGQVEEFRAILEASLNPASMPRPTDPKQALASLRRVSQESEIQNDGQQSKKHVREVVALQKEIQNLQETMSATEKANKKLQEENTKLTQELLHADMRHETHLEKCEKSRQRRDEAMQNLQKDYGRLKEQAKSQRRDAEQLLKKRHSQVVELKKEIASMLHVESTTKDLQLALEKKAAERDRVVSDNERQVAELMKHTPQESVGATDLKNNPKKPERATVSDSLSRRPIPTEPQARESLIPVLSQSISRPSKSPTPSRQSRSETPAGSRDPRSSQTALSEIINNASPNTLPPQRSGPVQYTPVVQHFSNMSLESPGDLQLPSSVPSLPQIPSRTIHDRNCHPSPRPSMFNIASSPPKAAVVRLRKSDDLSRKSSTNDLESGGRTGNMASSRLSSMDESNSRARRMVPPERAAAAKARLEQKMLEKRKAQYISSGADKENIRN